MPLNIDSWGLDVVIGGSQKAFMVPPGLAFMSISPKAWKLGETSNLPHYYFNLKKEKKSGDAGESSWTPATAMILALGEALVYVKQVGMAELIKNAQMLAYATRGQALETAYESHFSNAIELFWVVVVVGMTAAPLIYLFGLGLAIDAALLAWLGLRIAKGLGCAFAARPCERP